MTTIGPEVSSLQMRGAKANVGFRPAVKDAGYPTLRNINDPTLPEGPKAALLPVTQISADEIARGFVDPARTVQSNQLPLKGYTPQWKFVQPPGVGDAPQHIYDILALIPVPAIVGSSPLGFLRSVQSPVVQNFAMRMQGMPVSGGNVLLTGLYTPDPINAPPQP